MYGRGPNEKLGSKVAMSHSGDRVAVASWSAQSASYHARVFERRGESWMQIGDEIVEDYIRSLAISSVGRRVAIGVAIQPLHSISSVHILEWD